MARTQINGWKRALTPSVPNLEPQPKGKSMDVNKILEELRREHAQLGEAILSLERLAAGGKRRGRPPAWLQAAQQTPSGRPAANASAPPKKRGRKKKSQADTAD